MHVHVCTAFRSGSTSTWWPAKLARISTMACSTGAFMGILDQDFVTIDAAELLAFAEVRTVSSDKAALKTVRLDEEHQEFEFDGHSLSDRRTLKAENGVPKGHVHGLWFTVTITVPTRVRNTGHRRSSRVRRRR